MRYLTAFLLAVMGGNDSPKSKDLKKILDSLGNESDDGRLKKVIGELSGNNIEDVIAQGSSSKLASMPAGGAVTVAANTGSDALAAGGPASAAAAEEKKEEKKEEFEESDEDMGIGLFD